MADLASREVDRCSFANIDSFGVQNCHISLKVDFSTKSLLGFVEYNVRRKSTNNKHMILDSKALQITKAICNGKEVGFTLGEPHKALGTKLLIEVPQSSVENKIRIYYETTAGSDALDWLDPLQTAGKKHPYVYSQCQSILARTMLPCQDTPAVRIPYTAEISVPQDLVAVMSAVKLDTRPDPENPGYTINKFEQKIAIPSYLIAIAVGALEHREIGPRSKVWSEKELVDAAAAEFSETEQMLQIAEGILGPYVWGVYDLLVLPPSFPYGGMENPCLTFVTPSLVTGDKSMTLTVGHEISHSWTGNLVTNKTHEHFWLNEGNTVFMERKIAGRLKGEPFRQFEALNGWYKLKEVVRDFEDGHPFNSMLVDCTDIDPDDAFSKIPYEKGSALLMYLEQQLGGPDVFEPFLRAYIEHFKHKSLTTAEWKEFLYQYFADKKAILDQVDWNEWFYGRAMPPAQPSFDKTIADAVVDLSEQWSNCLDENLSQFSETDVTKFSAHEIKGLLQQLLDKNQMSAAKLRRFDELYEIKNRLNNPEIRFRWHRLCIKAQMPESINSTLEFLKTVGRFAYHRPLNRDLYNWSEARQAAIDNFWENKKYWNNITVRLVAIDLHLEL